MMGFWSTYLADGGIRFIRADRSGMVVSRSFDWRQEPQNFAEFLWRFAHLTPEQRGRDTTLRPATAGEKSLALLNLRPWEPKREQPIVVVRVPDDDQGGFREVIAWGAMADADSLTGRATRGWPVYDLKLKKVIFLKNSWHSLVPGMEKESEILSELSKAGMRNVPKLVCGDNIGHLTCTHEFLSKPWNVGGTKITPRTQHRFLEDFVGKIYATLLHPSNLCKLFTMHLLVCTLLSDPCDSLGLT